MFLLNTYTFKIIMLRKGKTLAQEDPFAIPFRKKIGIPEVFIINSL